MSRNEHLPFVYIARHGETRWAKIGRHTGATDIPLTERGEANARALGQRLQALDVSAVLNSPLQRAWRTCELAGFGERARTDDELVEWDYGAYEGKTTPEIQQERPGWEVFRDGCPQGDSVSQVAARADRAIARLRSMEGSVLMFSHSHFLRVLAARWLGLEAEVGRCLYLGTGAFSILGYEHGRDDPVIHLWNDTAHVKA